jgi:uncharacterized protein (TIGR02246 family)
MELQMNTQTDVQQINAVLLQYETGLNSEDTTGIVALYTQDGIFVPQHFPAQVGIKLVEEAYKRVFQMLKLDVTFTIHEVEVFGGLAYARTTSRGTQTLRAENLQTDEYNNELFVFRREGEDWKIARYLFATANPPR